jgi:hypothetical protein
MDDEEMNFDYDGAPQQQGFAPVPQQQPHQTFDDGRRML